MIEECKEEKEGTTKRNFSCSEKGLSLTGGGSSANTSEDTAYSKKIPDVKDSPNLKNGARWVHKLWLAYADI